MKVLFVLNTTVMGGGNISFINMVKGLYEKGVKCCIVSPDRIVDSTFKETAGDAIENYYYAPLYAYVHDDITCYHGFRKFKKVVKYILKKNPIARHYSSYKEMKYMNRIVAEVKPDMIHTNVGVLQAGYTSAKKFGIPHIWHLREYQTKDFYWKIEPSFNGFIKKLHDSYVITITKDIQNYFHLENDSTARCIYNGCLFKSDSVMDLDKDKYFLCCSRISPEKGHKDVVKAFATFYKIHPEYKLVIAGFGDPRYIQELKNDAAHYGCLKAIDFIGFQKDVKPLMRKAKALIVASRFEGFGRMTAEAAISGCPVIGHNTGGTKEIMDITGGFSYLNGPVELAEKMEEAADMSPDIYAVMVQKAQEKAVKYFSNESNIENVYSFYREIMKSKV